jgi:hypothetical protein
MQVQRVVHGGTPCVKVAIGGMHDVEAADVSVHVWAGGHKLVIGGAGGDYSIDLPCMVDDERTVAHLSRSQSTLVVRMPVTGL